MNYQCISKKKIEVTTFYVDNEIATTILAIKKFNKWVQVLFLPITDRGTEARDYAR